MSANEKPSLLEYAVKELKQENVRQKDEELNQNTKKIKSGVHDS